MRLTTMRQVRLPISSIRLMADLLSETGRGPTLAAHNAGVPLAMIENPDAEVSGLQELAFQREFFQQTADRPDLWIELGRRYRILTHGHVALGLAMATAANLRRMFDTSLVYADLHYTTANTSLLERDGQLVGFRSSMQETPQALRQFTLIRDVASCNIVWYDFWGDEPSFNHIETAISPRFEKLVRPLFCGVPVTFGAAASAWHWREGLGDRTLRQSNPQLHAQFIQQCATAMQTRSSSDQLRQELECLFSTLGHDMTLEAAATQLRLSKRTLQRRLQEHRLSFRELGNEARHQRACELLKTGDGSVATIAWALGYQDVSSFHRSFVKCTGISPGAWRRLHGPAAGEQAAGDE